jgi:Tol biopolymer transport system component
MFMTQNGAIYSLSGGRFHQLTRAGNNGTGWMQLSLYPGNNLLAVNRQVLYSDVYILNRFGTVVRKITSNNVAPRNPDPAARHWSFYPRLSTNNKTLFMSYDKPKFGFDVPMSIWSMPLGGSITRGKLWSISIDYTGGDIQPLPLKGGALIYTKYSYGPSCSGLESQIWITNQPEQAYGGARVCYPPAGVSHGRALTSPSEGCAQPTLSPDGKTMAMICTHKTQVSYLELASWNGSRLGARRIIVGNQLVAQPTWAPDGTGLAYLAPAQLGAGFQLWWLPKAGYEVPKPAPSPSASAAASPSPGRKASPSPTPKASPKPSPSPTPAAPIQVTNDLGFDASSPIAWHA